MYTETYRNSTPTARPVAVTEYPGEEEPPSDNPPETVGLSPRSRAFMMEHFPSVTEDDWRSWEWQVRNSYTSLVQLSRVLTLSEDELASILPGNNTDALPVRVTPYYASLMDPRDPLDPIRRTMVPVVAERHVSAGEASDPLDEKEHSPVPHLVHRYPDRVLLLVTMRCAAACRFCTRSHSVSKWTGMADLDPAFAYIGAHPEVRDVLVSGGDPLTLGDRVIDGILSRLRTIPHVEIVRIGTKVPVVMPQRVTANLCRVLRKHHPLFINIHFTHPKELTSETMEACARLADAGIPLGSQTVLLRGVNDDLETMKSLFIGLVRARIKPYYLYSLDPVPGSGHFKAPLERGIEIMRGLVGHTSGYARPTFVVDAPGGGGKIPILPEYYHGREGDEVVLSNYEGRTFRYPDPETPEG